MIVVIFFFIAAMREMRHLRLCWMEMQSFIHRWYNLNTHWDTQQ